MDQYPVYLKRPWINYSTNVFSGWTITVTADTGGYVITALALLVQVAGEAMWTIAALTIHQFRASDMPQTGLFRQTQVILRNPSTTLATSFQLIQAGWKWHGVVDSSIRRTTALAAWPMLLFVGFITAGIFVSRVTKPAYGINQVLLRSTNCGLENSAITPSDEVAYYSVATKWASDIRQSRAYVSKCYDKPDRTLGCTSLPVQQLPYTTQMNVTCPLGRRCMGTAQFDTGLLDSHKHLGINAKYSDRVNFQMITTCAPIDIIDTYRLVPDPLAIGGWFLLRTYLGQYSIFNYTYSYPTMDTARAMPYTLA